MDISQLLQDFLTAFCGADEDLEETARVLRSAPDSELVGWLKPELDVAIRDELISPADAEYLMARSFDRSSNVAAWLGELRKSWFG